MKHLWLVAPVAFLSCAQSEHPVATPKPTKALARVSGKSFSELKRGYGVYQKHCAQCHEHRLPNTVTLPEWHAQIDAMAEVAGLPPEEEESLQIYLGEFSDR